MRCTIHFENIDHVYFAGQMLKGTIEMILNDPQKIRGLYFILDGRAKCGWSEVEHEKGQHRRERTRVLNFKGEEIFINQRTFLLGADGAAPIEVADGTYRYELACQLPGKLPASYEDKHGFIRYKVEAVIDVILGFNKKFEEKFTINSNDDLNLHPELFMPCKSEEIRSFCCLCCKSGPFKMEVTIPISGFAPGQNIPVTVAFDNKSKIDCEQTTISLNLVIRYNSTTPHENTKIEAKEMTKVFGQGISAGSSTIFTQELEIPQKLQSSNILYCKAVQVTYELKVEGKIKGCHRNVEIIFPIIIGSVAISSDQAKTYQAQIDSFETAPAAPHIGSFFGTKITQNKVFVVSSPTDAISSFDGPTAPTDENGIPPKGRINRW